MIQECILTSIRESIPTEAIIRAYMDETVEEEEEEVFVEPIPEEEKKEETTDTSGNVVTEELKQKVEEELPPVLSVENMDDEKVVTRLTFNDTDEASDGTMIQAPKDIDHLEEISEARNIQRKLEDEDSDDEMPDSIKIHTDDVDLDGVFDLDTKPNDSVVLSDVQDL